MKKQRISLFIITHNEEANIAKCILSAKDLVNEVVVVDSFSTDKTTLICRDLGANIYTHKFEGFTKQKNFALSKVTSQWALSLDADETLTPELVEEIRKAVQDDTIDGYKLTRVNHFLGKRMNHSGIDKEHILRLVRTEKAEYRGGLVHEVLHVEGKVKRLKGVFEHRSYTDIDGYFVKFNKYTSLAAETMFKKGKKCSIPVIVLRTPLEFLRRYILRLGFLDGVRGLIWAAFSAFYTFVKYIKLWFLWQRNRFQ